MERYIYFDNEKKYNEFLSNNISSLIGKGSEGNAYLTNDNKVIKTLRSSSYYRFPEKDKKDIIMDDYHISSYLLPQKLYILNNEIVGYITDYFPNNILRFSDSFNGSINDINTNNLLAAYYKMISDTRILTKDKVLVYDLTFNLLFDNHVLGAIDTYNYYRDPSVTLDQNIASIDYAILHELHFHDVGFVPDYHKSLEYNLKRIKR